MSEESPKVNREIEQPEKKISFRRRVKYGGRYLRKGLQTGTPAKGRFHREKEVSALAEICSESVDKQTADSIEPT